LLHVASFMKMATKMFPCSLLIFIYIYIYIQGFFLFSTNEYHHIICSLIFFRTLTTIVLKCYFLYLKTCLWYPNLCPLNVGIQMIYIRLILFRLCLLLMSVIPFFTIATVLTADLNTLWNLLSSPYGSRDVIRALWIAERKIVLVVIKRNILWTFHLFSR